MFHTLRWKKMLTALLCLGSAALFPLSAAAVGPSEFDYVVRAGDGEHVPVPKGYRVTGIWNALGGTVLNNPEDLFVKGEFAYIADTKANRILKLDLSGRVVAEFTKGEKPFNEPRGVFVDDEGCIYVADTGNQCVVKLDAKGGYIKSYVKPDSSMLADMHTFDVNKVAVNPNGFLYLTKGKDLMLINEDNEFKGYIGAGKLGFSLNRMFVRLFASDEQRNKIEKEQPPPFNNIYYKDGFIYATAVGETEQIRRINIVGENLMPAVEYGEKIEHASDSIFRGKWSNPNFIDVTVDQDDVVSAIEQQTGRIYQYDLEGRLLLCFGGLGESKGYFSKPVAIGCDADGNLYVLDSAANNVQVFSPTAFTTMCHRGLKEYGDGRYEEARQCWTQVADMDAGYTVARDSLGKIAYKQKEYETAMEQYLLAENQAGYGQAFSKYRYELFQIYFAPFVIGIVLVLIGLAAAVRFLIRRANRLSADFFTIR